MSQAGAKEAKVAHTALPEFKAILPSESQAEDKKKLAKPTGKKTIKKGGKGKTKKAPKLGKDPGKGPKKMRAGAGLSAVKKGKDGEPDKAQMKKNFKKGMKKVKTSSGVNTSAGPPPKVQLGGDADPGRAATEASEAMQNIAKSEARFAGEIAKVDSSTKVVAKGMEETVKVAEFNMPDIASPSADKAMVEFMNHGHDKAVYDKADGIMAPEFNAHLGKADAQFNKAIDKRDADRDKAVEDGQAEMEELNEQARKDQDKETKKARGDIEKGKKDTKKKQDKELKKAKRTSDKERKKVEKSISKEKKKADTKVAAEYKKGEKKASDEKRKAEQKAAAEKRKEEEKRKKMSWWQRAKAAVSSFFDKLCAIVGSIFDALSKAVAGIINAVKDAACKLIDAAVAFACKALDALGGLLKSLVTNLLGDIFPGLAKALNELIDQAVGKFKAAVQAVGEWAKKGITALADKVNGVIQMVLNVAKVAIQTGLTVAAAVVTGDWEKAARAMLEGALNIAGIAPAEFYGFVGSAMDTIKAIIKAPGKFIKNLIGAVSKGFTQFKTNFVTHLMAGIVKWLTGQMGDAGLKMPDKWDSKGIFDLVLQIMGLSKQKILAKVEKKVGKENMKRMKFVWGFIEAAIQGGLAGLWEHTKEQIGNLWDMVIDGIKGFLMEKIVKAAVTKIASLFSPVGAIVQALLTAYNLYKFIKEQAAKIMALLKAIVSSIAAIVEGKIGPAANWIEGVLAKGVPIVISLLANLLGLGGIGKKVREVIGKFQEKIDKALDKLIDTLWEKGKGDAIREKAEEVGNKAMEPARAAGRKVKAGAKKAASAVAEKTKPAVDKVKEKGKPLADAHAKLNEKMAPLNEKAAKLDADMKKAHTDLKTLKDKPKKTREKLIKDLESKAAEVGLGADKLEKDSKAIGDKNAAALTKKAKELGKKAGVLDDKLDGTTPDTDVAAAKLPAPATFTTADGHKHKVYAEAKGDKIEAKVASTPIRVQKQIEIWRKVLKGMHPEVRKKAGKLIGKALTLERKIDKKANAQQVKKDQASLADLLKQIFDITSSTGTFEGQDPRESLNTSEFKKFKKGYKGLSNKVKAASGEIEKTAEEVWLKLIMALQSTSAEFKSLDALKGSPYKQLSGKTYEKLVAEFEEIENMLTRALVKEEGRKRNYSFWSGHPAKQVAQSFGKGTTLDMGTLGKLFDGAKLKIDKAAPTNSILLWGALSRAYANFVRERYEKGSDLHGFVGEGSDGESVFTQVERPALNPKDKAKVHITWYATVIDPTDPKTFDAKAKGGGPKGTIAKASGSNAKVRKDMVTAAIIENKIRRGEDPGAAKTKGGAPIPLAGGSPKAAIKKAGSWKKVKETYAEPPEGKEAMKELLAYRKQYVDSLIAHAIAGTDIKAKAFGSTNLTSDYDVSLKGAGNVGAVEKFNKRFRGDWKQEAGLVFDTNVYTDGNFLPDVDKNKGKYGKIKSKEEKLEPITNAKQKTKDTANQDAAALTKTRKHMSQGDWSDYKTNILNSIEDSAKKAQGKKAFGQAEKNYKKWLQELLKEAHRIKTNAEADDKKFEIAVTELEKQVDTLHKANPDIELLASNNLYVKKLRLVEEAEEDRVEKQEKIQNAEQNENQDPAKLTALKKELDKNAVEVRKRQSTALMFANEAYFSAGAVRDVVGNNQAGYRLELEREELLQSFNENLGDTLKDLDKYSGNLPEASIQSSKYVLRLSQSATNLSKAKDKTFALSEEANNLRKWSKMLIKICKGSGEYGAMSGEQKNEAAKTRSESYGYDSTSALKSDVVAVGAFVNVEARKK